MPSPRVCIYMIKISKGTLSTSMGFPPRAQKGAIQLNGTFKYQAMGERMYCKKI